MGEQRQGRVARMAGASVSYRTVGQGGWDKPKQGVKVVRMCLRSRSFSFSFTWFPLLGVARDAPARRRTGHGAA